MINLNSTKITVGCDPEIFIREGETLLPSEYFVHGTKTFPQDLGDEYSVLCDNVMLEYCMPPANTQQEFVDNNKTALAKIKQLIPSSCDLAIIPTGVFKEEIIFSTQKHKEFGCEPDLNIYGYDGCFNNIVDEPKRFAGAHLHVGYDKSTYNNIEARLVKMLDVLIGVPSIILDNDTERRSMYGMPGRYRLKPYGIEYRTVSNFWLQNEDYMRFVYNQTVLALEAVIHNIDTIYEENVFAIIANSDVEAATEYCQRYDIQLPTIKEFNNVTI